MAELGLFEVNVFKDKSASDTAQVPAASATVTVYKEGAWTDGAGGTINDGVAGDITVHDIGTITTSDTLQYNTNTDITLSINTITGTTTINVTPNGGNLIWEAGNRLVNLTAPTLYSDDQSGDTKTNGLTADATGRAWAYTDQKNVDYIVSGSGLTTTLYSDHAVLQPGRPHIDVADYANLQDALDAVPAAGAQVFIPAGTYTYSAKVTIPSNCHLKGAGRNITILKQADSVDLTDVFQNSDTTNGNTFVTIEDITFDGNKANNTTTASTMLNWMAGGDLVIRNCEWKNNRGQALELESSGTVDLARVWIVDCYFHDGAPSGVTEEMIRIDANSATTIEDVFITNCKFKNMQSAATGMIHLAGVDAAADPIKRVTIQGCSFEDCGSEAAIYVTLANDVLIDGNYIYDVDGHGVFVSGANVADEVAPQRIIVSNNSIITYGKTAPSASGNGIEVSSGGNSVSVTGNTCQDGQAAAKVGISVGSVQAAAITGNTVLESDGGGIHCRAKATLGPGTGAVVISGNTIDADSDMAEDGIAAFISVPGVIIANNSIRNYQRGIYFFNNTDGPITNGLIQGNTVTSCSSIGIYLRGRVTGSTDAKRCIVKGNVLDSNGSHGIVLSDVTESVIAENISYNNTGHGIRFEDTNCDKNIVLGNICYDNSSAGISCGPTDMDDTIISNNICTGNTGVGIICDNASYAGLVISDNLARGNASPDIDITATTSPNRGTFTAANAATTVVTNTLITAQSVITIMPTNAAAATLMAGAASLYVSAKTEATSFTVATADASSAAGTETFDFYIES
jgi:parallel beta-helix repeat protein